MTAPAQGQIVVGDPLNASKTFSSYCSACHRSASSLAKGASGSTLASFLRQHYTTGPEMSAAMAAYLVQAGNDPRARQRAGQDAGTRDNIKDNKAAASRRQAARTDPAATDVNARQPSPEAQSPATTPGSIIAPERQNRRQLRASARPPEPPARTVPTTAAPSPDPPPSIEATPALEPAPAAQAEAVPPAMQARPDYWASSP